MVERPTCAQEVAGSLPNTLQMVVMAALLGAQRSGIALPLTGWCQDKWTRSTINLARKRRDITETVLKAAYNTNQSINQSISKNVIKYVRYNTTDAEEYNYLNHIACPIYCVLMGNLYLSILQGMIFTSHIIINLYIT